MTDVIQLLQQTATQLQQEGKTPSLALFRSRLAGKVAPQPLFAAYQQWRSNPVYADLSPNQSCKAPPVVLAHSDDIDTRLARIEAKLDLLLKILEQR